LRQLFTLCHQAHYAIGFCKKETLHLLLSKVGFTRPCFLDCCGHPKNTNTFAIVFVIIIKPLVF